MCVRRGTRSGLQLRRSVPTMSGDSADKKKPPRLPLLTPRQSEFMRRAVDIEDLDPTQRGLGFQARLWAQVSLPYRDPGNVPSWSRRNGSVTLVIDPAIISSRLPDGSVERGFPYGVVPRLLMAWMATEAIRTKDRRLEIGSSMARFMRELGMGAPSGGKNGNITRMREQVQRLAGCRIAVLDGRATGGLLNSKMDSIQVASKWDLWMSPKDEHQAVLFPSSITLSEEFYNSILAAPIPMKMQHLSALRSFRGSGMAIDIYTWLSWRMFNLQRTSRLITWERLGQQFGADYARTRAFKAQFLRQLRPVTIVYPEARILIQDDGIVLRPSPTPVEAS